MSLFREAGYSATTRNVPRVPRAQDQHYVADLYVSRLALNEIRGVAIAISTVHDFHGSADNPQRRMAPCAILTLTALSQRAEEKVESS